MEKMKKEEKIYKTDSFYLSSFLIAKGCELAGVEPSDLNSNKFIFCFLDSKRLQKLKEEFFSLKATVNPQAFANAQKNLRLIIYSKRA